jgi:hypothetical protein
LRVWSPICHALPPTLRWAHCHLQFVELTTIMMNELGYPATTAKIDPCGRDQEPDFKTESLRILTWKILEYKWFIWLDWTCIWAVVDFGVGIAVIKRKHCHQFNVTNGSMR